MNLLIIQVSAGEAVVAKFARKGGHLLFLKAERHEITPEAPLETLLPALKEERDSRIILSIPASELFFREVEIPISDRRKLREVLPLELKGETALDTDELLFDAVPVEEGRVLAVWCRKSQIAEQIRMLAGCGLEPEIVTSSMLHWQHLLPEEGRERPIAITDGEGIAFFRNGRPFYFRSLATGKGRTEIARTVAAVEASREVEITSVYLHGPALRDTADTYAGEPLPPTAEMASLFSGTDAAGDLASSYAVARGCTTGEPVNFRQGDLAYTAGKLRARRKLLLPAALAAALIVLVFGELGLRYYLVKRDLDSLNNSIRTMYRQIFPERKKPVDEVAELRSEIKRLGGTGTGGNVLSVVKKVADLKNEEITGIYEIEVEGAQVRLKGDARSVQAANDFRARSATVFENPELGEVKSRPDGTVSFAFRAAAKGGGK